MSLMNKVFKHIFTIKCEQTQSFLSGAFYADFSKSRAGHLRLAKASGEYETLLRERTGGAGTTIAATEIARELSFIAD